MASIMLTVRLNFCLRPPPANFFLWRIPPQAGQRLLREADFAGKEAPRFASLYDVSATCFLARVAGAGLCRIPLR